MTKRTIITRFLLFIFLFALIGCTSVSKDSNVSASTKRTVVSPSGKYLLKVVEEKVQGIPHSKFLVASNVKDSQVLYTCPDSFRSDDTLYFVWDRKDRVWVYSDDAGTFFWSMSAENQWERHDYFTSKEPAPEFLKKAKPENHPI